MYSPSYELSKHLVSLLSPLVGNIIAMALLGLIIVSLTSTCSKGVNCQSFKKLKGQQILYAHAPTFMKSSFHAKFICAMVSER